jgi:hypothetical protein
MILIRYDYNRYVESVLINTGIKKERINILAFRSNFITIDLISNMYSQVIRKIYTIIEDLDVLNFPNVKDFYIKPFSKISRKIYIKNLLRTNSKSYTKVEITPKLPLTWENYYLSTDNIIYIFRDCPNYNVVE